MRKYSDTFRLDPKDIELIEAAIRREIERESHKNGGLASNAHIRELHKLLGKLFSQKRFFSQVHHTGVPAG